MDDQKYITPKFASAVKSDMQIETEYATYNSTTASLVENALIASDEIDNPGNDIEYVVKLKDMAEFIKTFENK